MKITEENWFAHDGQIYPEQTGKTVAIIPYFDKDNEEHRANQQLLAAAPKLYKTLRSVQSGLDTLKGMNDIGEIKYLITKLNQLTCDLLYSEMSDLTL